MANNSHSTQRLFRFNSYTVAALVSLLFGCTMPPAEHVKPVVTDIPSPSVTPKSEPNLVTSGDSVYLSWIEEHGDTSALNFATLQPSNWSKPKQIAAGNTWFVNWADYPMMTVKDDKLVAHFLDRHGDEPHAYDIKITQSNDEGSTWSTPALLHDDGKAAEHGFVSMIPYEQNYLVCWLDGRNAAMEGNNHHEHHGSMTLRAAIVNDAGKKLQEWELDERTCDCCQTAAAMTSTGPVVVYRDRSHEEVRDMSIVRLIDGSWTKPESIYNDNWMIKGCPVNGPRVSAKEHTLVIAWYSVKDEQPIVKVIFSTDDGKSFGEPIQINEAPTIGRVDIELLDRQTAIVSWMEGKNIMAARVHASGKKEPSVLVATSSSARSSGFPQLTLLKGRAVFAWTDDSLKNVRSAFVDF